MTEEGKMKKPENSEFYGWKSFVRWANKNGVQLEHKEDWEPWWNCWKAAYCVAMNE